MPWFLGSVVLPAGRRGQVARGRGGEAAGDRGFTLIELLVVIIMATVLAAIAAPSWLNFVNSQRLSTAQEAAFNALREAQTKSRQNRRAWAVCFRTNGSDKSARAEYAVQPVQTSGNPCATASWKPMSTDVDSGVELANSSNLPNISGQYVAQFNERGWLSEDAAAGKRVVFQMANQPELKMYSCVYVETLLGALRGARDQKNCAE